MLKITEAYKTAIISTAHVTAEDPEQLPIACFDPITDRGLNWVHGTEYGCVRAGMRDNSWADELLRSGDRQYQDDTGYRLRRGSL